MFFLMRYNSCCVYMKKISTKYIFVVGGIMSGIGKGVTTSSVGTILSHYGYAVNLMKVDPYLNVDAGTMSPTEHGEVFVLSSGLETDQDMGNYERFLNRDLSAHDYMTSGMVYKAVIDRERSFGYNGKCVEAIPHLVDEVRSRIEISAKRAKAEVQVIEIGGTLGDYQNLLFLEAGRQMLLDDAESVLFVLVTYLPLPPSVGEMKTRPTQNAVRTLNSYGINPSVIVARSEGAIDTKRKEKIARACSIIGCNIVSAPDVESVYDVPVNFEKSKVASIIIDELGLPKRKVTGVLPAWKRFSAHIQNNKKNPVKIGIIGKYFETGSYTLSDSYVSVIEAIKFSCVKERVRPDIEWLSAKKFEGKNAAKTLKGLEKYDALIIPGGFGKRGAEGKMAVIKYARERGIPILGICYGMQLMVVEFMRSVVGKRTANSIEVDPKTAHPVITVMEDQERKLSEKLYGGSMRLGAYTAYFEKGTLAHNLYNANTADERHRHRYEVNDAYVDEIEEHGLNISAFSKAGLVEAVELPIKEHPFFIGTQYHPEFTARPLDPNPLFNGLMKAAKKRKGNREKSSDGKKNGKKSGK